MVELRELNEPLNGQSAAAKLVHAVSRLAAVEYFRNICL